MAQTSSIEWTDATWNPVTGCTKISPGCKNCYAERMAKRLHAMGQNRYRNCFEVTLHHDLLRQPQKWTKPKTIFVNSMSDLFHKNVPFDFIKKIFDTMNQTPWHTYQILTKRAHRLAQLVNKVEWSKNIWVGVSVESQQFTERINHLHNIPAFVRFLSIEPLVGPITNLPLSNIDWVIVGGESGPHARPMEAEWVRTIRDICINRQVPFFFKQWGGTRKTLSGRVLDGKKWSQFPTHYNRMI
ncbi:MAG: phage Gp37/Gp68 family protein [Thermodesulfobacteriota bacterium]